MSKLSKSIKKNFDFKSMMNSALSVVQDMLGLSGEEEARKVTLNDIKVEDVQRGKIRLEHKQNAMMTDLRDMEKQKRLLFEEGVQKASAREQKALASKIKQLDQRMRIRERYLEGMSSQLQIVDYFLLIKEQEQLNKELGLESIFGDMEMTELVAYMQKANEDGELNMTMMNDLAKSLYANTYIGKQDEDPDVLEIMKQMQLAREDHDGAVDEYFVEMEGKLAEKHERDSDDFEFSLEEDI
jgi:hypothetical protein